MINALLMSLNQLKKTDIIFFVCCAVAIVLAVAVYFLIPVFNKKQYQEQRDNLRKREEAFKANKKFQMVDDAQVDEVVAEETLVQNDADTEENTVLSAENGGLDNTNATDTNENTDGND